MQINIYNNVYNEYFNSPAFQANLKDALSVLKVTRNIFFIGNGGSNAICSHMLEDYAKIAGFRTFAFSDPSLITCFSNDYGYDQAMAEWLKIYAEEGDLLFAISSSGNSKNILNATNTMIEKNGNVITLSGFKDTNILSTKGLINFHIAIENYGVVECFHQVILHVLLDEHVAQLKK